MSKLTYSLVAAAISACCASQSASAQTKFEGLFGQIGIGYEHTSLSMGGGSSATLGGTTYPFTSSLGSENGFNGALSVGYALQVSPRFLVALGGDYIPFSSPSSNFSYGINGANINGTYKKNNAYNIFLSPGFAIDENKLVYIKAGYTGAEFQGTSNSVTNSGNLTGYSLGLGYKQIISGGLYGFAEGNYYNYGNKSYNTSGLASGSPYSITENWSANSYNILLGVGYKF